MKALVTEFKQMDTVMKWATGYATLIALAAYQQVVVTLIG